MIAKSLTVRAFLRTYRVEYSEKYKTRVAIPVRDSVIADYKCPHEAYKKTQRLIKKDYDNGIVQDVCFQCNYESKSIQLSLF